VSTWGEEVAGADQLLAAGSVQLGQAIDSLVACVGVVAIMPAGPWGTK
jgi:hypothetical protein